MYLIKISAEANHQKETEFLQALDSAFKRASRFGEMKSSFSKDVYKDYLFHIELSWKNEEEMNEFIQSKDYEYLVGALTVLGEVKEKQIIKTNPENLME